jgi:hypothetical protein
VNLTGGHVFTAGNGRKVAVKALHGTNEVNIKRILLHYSTDLLNSTTTTRVVEIPVSETSNVNVPPVMVSRPVNLKTKDLRTVKELVKYPDGRPVDIAEAAETGTLAGIYGDLDTLVNVMFAVCLDQVKESFDLPKYDADNRTTYGLFPEQADEPPLTKASRWFGSLIDGDSLIGMIEAFQEAVINFTPSATRRTALQKILEKEREIDRMESEYRLAAVNRMFEQTRSGLENRIAGRSPGTEKTSSKGCVNGLMMFLAA